VGIAVLAVGFSLGQQLRHAPPVAAQVATAAGPNEINPFVAKRREVYYPLQGEPKISVRTMLRRSDGSVVDHFEATSPKGETGDVMVGSDLRRGVAFWTEPFTQSVTTFYLSDAEINQRRSDQDRCAETDIRTALSAASRNGVPRSAILGFDTVRVERPGPHLSSVEWVSPTLGCLALRETQTFADGSHNEFEITEISVAEPPDAEFIPPPGLTERSPAEVEAAYAADYATPFYGARMVSVMEKRYRDHLANRRD
jgi:hypothetical protein